MQDRTERLTLLLNERPVVIEPSLVRRFIQPSLVRRFGMLEAALIQQLHYWTGRSTCQHDDHTWVDKTYTDWAAETGASAKACRGALDRLRERGAVVAIQNPRDGSDRTLWWRIDYARVDV